MVVQEIFAITRRPGVHLGGRIESGVVRVGDRLRLMDGGTLIRVITCDGISFLDNIAHPERTLVTVHATALKPGDVQKGQVLAGTQIRPLDAASWPHSISGPLAERLTAECAGFASRTAGPLLAQIENLRNSPGTSEDRH